MELDTELFQGDLDRLAETVGTDEPDLPPEYCHYRDEGCEVATAYLGRQSYCSECPFPKCIYEESGGKQRWLKELRNREMLRQFTTEGKGIKELALAFRVSQRTVQRVLKRAGNE